MTRRLVLASASPRRRELLRAAGFEPEVLESDLDDALVSRGHGSVASFIAALAWFKARRVAATGRAESAVVVAADTMCLDGDRMLGKPRDAGEALAMLRSLRGKPHRTLTGVAVLEPDGHRRIFVDTAHVTVGRLDDAAIESYVASGAWRGKAGGYNYSERIEAGWPIACEGDATSVMGLPMRRLAPLLDRIGVPRC